MTGFEPAASTSRTSKRTVLSGILSEVASSVDSRCTTSCTSGSEKRVKTGSDAVALPIEAESLDDFASALAMIATLPLSNSEKAEAVRRLLLGGKSE
ncbi:MAG: hypothetical protein JWP89_4856 [Schlesneria sp.]|nr:hypothetical protein [Schlesneria sp.]